MDDHCEVVRGHRPRIRDNLRKIRDFRLHAQDHSELIEQYYIGLDSAVSLSCLILFRYGEFDQLVKKEVDPDRYLDTDPLTFADDFAAVSFLQKNRFLKTSFDKKAVALEAFHSFEGNCGVVNRTLKQRLSQASLKPEDWYVLSAHTRKIASILGSFNIAQVFDCCSWGPGVSLLVKGDDVSPSRKFDEECNITPVAYRLYLPAMKAAYPHWDKLSDPKVVKGNRVVTVPKNAKTDRTIAIEPGLNSWIQLGIGKSIRKRLRSAGYNLDSDLKNQRGAYVGSLDGSLATIDFKAASDSISISLVRELLPHDWFTCMDAARSYSYTLDGLTYHTSEKFSTMGNGFTFELESLIFVTLALAICECLGVDDSSVSIFGDDLVIPPECIPHFSRFCELYGFTINDKKSFSSGPFRESCGSYYFSGCDVKPLYHKEALRSLKSVYRFANSVRLLAHRRGALLCCDGAFKRLWHSTVRLVPLNLRFFGPSSAGDAVIHENIRDDIAWKSKFGWEGFYFSGIPTISVSKTKDSLGLHLSRLYYPSQDRALNNSVSLRAKVRIIFKKDMWTGQWYDFGPWISESKH